MRGKGEAEVQESRRDAFLALGSSESILGTSQSPGSSRLFSLFLFSPFYATFRVLGRVHIVLLGE